MNYADFFTQPDGFPLESDATLGFMQTDYQDAIKALAKMAGTDLIIISGLVEAGSSVSEGWILYNGDLIYFEAGTKSSTFIIEETIEQKANQNGTLVDRYTTKVAKFGTGSGSVSYSSLKRIGTIIDLVTRLKYVIGMENGVIVNGMAVSNVSGGNCDISAGTILIDDQFVAVSAYSGAYPAYLKPDGSYVTSVPGSGSYITFDPHPSQRLQHVFRRSMTPAGEIIMTKAALSSFDGTGLGKWEYKGWALCNGSNGTVDLRSRFVVGYTDQATDPGDNRWDAAYKTLANTGGEKNHELTIEEMPSHNHTLGPGDAPVVAGNYGLVRRSATGNAVTNSGVDATGSGNEPDIVATPRDIPYQGDGDPHENRPPFLVVAFLQRI